MTNVQFGQGYIILSYFLVTWELSFNCWLNVLQLLFLHWFYCFCNIFDNKFADGWFQISLWYLAVLAFSFPCILTQLGIPKRIILLLLIRMSVLLFLFCDWICCVFMVQCCEYCIRKNNEFVVIMMPSESVAVTSTLNIENTVFAFGLFLCFFFYILWGLNFFCEFGLQNRSLCPFW